MIIEDYFGDDPVRIVRSVLKRDIPAERCIELWAELCRQEFNIPDGPHRTLEIAYQKAKWLVEKGKT